MARRLRKDRTDGVASVGEAREHRPLAPAEVLVDVATDAEHAEGFPVSRHERVLRTVGVHDAPAGFEAGIETKFNDERVLLPIVP